MNTLCCREPRKPGSHSWHRREGTEATTPPISPRPMSSLVTIYRLKQARLQFSSFTRQSQQPRLPLCQGRAAHREMGIGGKVSSPVDRLQPASVHSGGGRGQMLGFPMARVLLVAGHRALGRQPLTLAHNLVKTEAAEYET